MARGGRAPAEPVRVLVVGDVHGEFELLAETAAAVRASLGPLDAILAVGDVEPNRDEADAAGVHAPAKYRKLGDFPLLVEGLLELGAPLYFIGGNHEPWPALDEAGPGWWSDGVYFLGRAGVTEIAGLRVAFLSGIHSPRVTDAPRARRDTIKDCAYYTADEVRQVGRTAGRSGQVDLLLTHDWPAGIAEPQRGGPVGRPELRSLCESLRPRWHFCGHMHQRHRALVGPTEVVCLGHISSGPQALAVVERGEDGQLRLIEHVLGAQTAPHRWVRPGG
ncbi:metallophosphoesterase [Catellatospora sp. KI3]|uniref:metallophosphoesterase family protein n=1 Tax=Catellatospora sp. KI3 TaxID=3041620 RepID=UPI0024822BE5|nr:metallophosphoesterase [Catellatospora sp. KI3]MDI1462780.1 metallophosphoesterase [Catellatospora sp. KI3]